MGAGACSRNMGGLMDRVEGAPQSGGALLGRPIEEFEAEAKEAGQFVQRLIAQYKIECNLRRDGSARLASTKSALDGMRARLAQKKARVPNCTDRIVEQSDLADLVGGRARNRYFGALLSDDQATLHPGRFINGLLLAAEEAGATLLAHTRALGAVRVSKEKFRVMTSRGVITARNVVIATAGYSTDAFPVARRRIWPFGAHVIATAPMGEDLMRQINRERRVLTDTRYHWMVASPAPDEPRLLFSGGYLERPDVARWAVKLHRRLIDLFPELELVPVSNAWFGYMPINRPRLPQIGILDGIHYSSDTSWAVSLLLGHKVALRILGQQGSESVFDLVPLDEYPTILQPPSLLRLPARLTMSAMDAMGIGM
jgi:glycine/D-amino acid oxidase-like deaminating enzyme